MTSLPTQILSEMAQAGLSDELLGRAVRELLAIGTPSNEFRHTRGVRHKAQPTAHATGVAQEPGSAQAPEPPAKVAVSPPPLAATPILQSEGERDALVRLKVRFAEGGATNVVVPQGMLTALARYLRAPDEVARSWVRDRAQAAPANAQNRSGWVQQQIAQVLARDPG